MNRVTGIDSDVLFTILNHSEQNNFTLVIDCRPFLRYNLSHIKNAHNIHCPPIVKRRSAGCLAIENIIRCSVARSNLLHGYFSAVILYDDSTDCIDRLPHDSNMSLVLKTLTEDLKLTNVAFLKGGYGLFRSSYPQLTDGLQVEMPSSPPQTIVYQPSQDQGDPVEILPWLFLGNAYHASQERRLQALGIDSLLNVSTSHDVIAAPSPHFNHKRILVADNCVADISCWFSDAIHFIERVRNLEKKVLVHCKAGISRSATICLAYLMWKNKWSLEQAYDFLKDKRQLISPNLNFMRQLLEFESSLPSLDPSPSRPNHLPITPCSTQAVFSFDSPSNNTPSPPQLLCPSPLVSPS